MVFIAIAGLLVSRLFISITILVTIAVLIVAAVSFGVLLNFGGGELLPAQQKSMSYEFGIGLEASVMLFFAIII